MNATASELPRDPSVANADSVPDPADTAATFDYDAPLTRPVDIRRWLHLLADAPVAEPELLAIPHPRDMTGPTITISAGLYERLWVGYDSWNRLWADPAILQGIVDREIATRHRDGAE